MAQQSRTTLKTYFNTGDRPTEAQLFELIDSSFNDTINIKSYGAVGDGVADDTTAIQNAINAASSGNIVFIPPGTFNVTSTLTVNNAIMIMGAGYQSRIDVPSGLNDDTIYLDVPNCVCSNFRMTGPAVDNTNGLHFSARADDGMAFYMFVSGFGGSLGGIDMSQGSHGVVGNCVVESCSNGILQTSSIGRMSAYANRIYDCFNGYLLSGEGSEITGGIVEGVAKGDRGILISATADKNEITNLKLIDLDIGVRITPSTASDGRKNKFSNMDIVTVNTGFELNDVHYTHISNITFDDVANYGIDIDATTNGGSNNRFSDLSMSLNSGAVALRTQGTEQDLSFSNLNISGGAGYYELSDDTTLINTHNNNPASSVLSINSGGDLADKSYPIVSRSTVKQVFDSAGVMQEIAADNLETDYDGSNTKIGWHIEESRTNKLLDSRDMTTINWVKGVTVARDATGIDDVANTANTLGGDGQGAFDSLRQEFTVADDTEEYTYSCFIDKASNSTEVRCYFLLSGGTTIEVYVDFDPSDGTVQDSNGTYELQDYDGWWRVILHITNNNSGNTNLEWRVYPDQSGGGASCVADMGGMEQAVDFASSPMITGGSEFTRSADDVSFYSTDKIYYPGAILVNFKSANGSGTQTVFDLYSDANNRLYAERNSSNEIHVISVNGGSTVADLNLGTLADDTETTLCVSYDKNNLLAVITGGSVQSDSDVAIPNFDSFNTGSNYNSANYLNGYIKKLETFDKVFTSTTIANMV